METHELKTDPEVFDMVKIGRKKFEIRKNDRKFNMGDFLLLRKTVTTGQQMSAGEPLEYTGDEVKLLVIHILYGPLYGLEKGWVIMSIHLCGTPNS